MRKAIGILLLILAANNCFSQTIQHLTVAKDVNKLGFDVKRLQRIDTLFANYVKEGILPNAVSLIVKDGQIVHQSAYGFKDVENNEAIKATDIFRNASQTKAITSTVLMTLFEENKFALDDPIEKYLPMFAHPKVHVSGSVAEGNLETRPAKRSITIRHLLSHTSGYGYDPFGEKLEGFAYREPTTSEALLESFARVPLLHDPGERFTYGFSTDIVGLLAEVIGGKSLDVLVKERVLDPLGMKDTYFFMPKEKSNRLVKFYMRASDSTAYVLAPDAFVQEYPTMTDQASFCGGGGLSGTIEDYAKFCQMILNGGEFNNHRILSSKTVALMGSNQLKDIPSYHPFSLAFELTNEARYQRSMATVGSWKWGGAFGTDYLIDIKENMILLFYTNIHQTKNASVQDNFHLSVYQSMK